jgi:hypothetical protein
MDSVKKGTAVAVLDRYSPAAKAGHRVLDGMAREGWVNSGQRFRLNDRLLAVAVAMLCTGGGAYEHQRQRLLQAIWNLRDPETGARLVIVLASWLRLMAEGDLHTWDVFGQCDMECCQDPWFLRLNIEGGPEFCHQSEDGTWVGSSTPYNHRTTHRVTGQVMQDLAAALAGKTVVEMQDFMHRLRRCRDDAARERERELEGLEPSSREYHAWLDAMGKREREMLGPAGRDLQSVADAMEPAQQILDQVRVCEADPVGVPYG